MSVRVFIKPLNSCVQRRQNIKKWEDYIKMSREFELTDEMKNADEIWIWTCAFREDIKQNSFDYLNKINEQNLNKKIIVGGCMPNISPQLVKEYKDECDRENQNNCIIVPWRDEIEYFGNNIIKADNIFCEGAFSDNIDAYKKEHPDENVTFCDQFIKVVISEGCNCECVYCSERKMFPSYRSFDPYKIREYCEKKIKETGVFNVILIADSLGEYGCDLDSETNLPTLIQSILDIDDRVKIALNNMNPQYMILYFDEIKKFILRGKIKHINLPIQSACNKVLKDMNRKYTKQELQKIIDMFMSCGFTNYDTHILVGFDGETKNDFSETLEFIINNKVRYVLASKYMDVNKTNSEFYVEGGEVVPKISNKEKENRIIEAYEKCNNAEIIINCDDSNLNKERMRRINN